MAAPAPPPPAVLGVRYLGRKGLNTLVDDVDTGGGWTEGDARFEVEGEEEEVAFWSEFRAGYAGDVALKD